MFTTIRFNRLRRKLLRCWEIGLSALLLLAAAAIAARPAPLASGQAVERTQASAQCGKAQSSAAVITR